MEISRIIQRPVTKPCRSVDNYSKINKIEEGTYGVVFRGRDRQTQEFCALKKLKLEKEREGFPVTSLREISALMNAAPAHPNLVSLREVVVGPGDDNVFLVMDYVEHDLRTLLDEYEASFTLSEVKTLLLQCFEALTAMHSRSYVHRDLKTSNLLLNNRGNIRVADFGLCRKLPAFESLTPVVVTLWYRAPELLLGSRSYDWAIDCWSMGCIMAELLTGKPLFTGQGEIEQLGLIFKMVGAPDQDSWPEFPSLPHACKIKLPQSEGNGALRELLPSLSANGFDLLSALLCLNPAKRLTAHQALHHPFFLENPLPKDPSLFPTWPTKGNSR